MSFRCGIIGLPNVGKSTIFNALTDAHADVANYPFTTIQYNKGIVVVPDQRLTKLADLFQPERKVATTIEFYDIAGLVKGAHQGEGLGNQFLSHINDVEALCHVVRCFDDENVTHVFETVDPVRDIEVVDAELILKDLEVIEKRIKKTEPLLRGNQKLNSVMELYKKLEESLQKGIPLRDISITKDEYDMLSDISLLSVKPVLYVANVSEGDLPNGGLYVTQLHDYLKDKNAHILVISGQIEAELISLSQEEQTQYLASCQLSDSGLIRMIHASYILLDLVTFFTIVGPEVRAWTVRCGATASQAAGKIHTDFEKGFICAEVVSYDDLVQYGSWNMARDNGRLRQEGRKYIINDGDVCLFKFNVC